MALEVRIRWSFTHLDLGQAPILRRSHTGPWAGRVDASDRAVNNIRRQYWRLVGLKPYRFRLHRNRRTLHSLICARTTYIDGS